jgi:crossover junction endodeoxyribonuclease RusA
MIELTLPFPPSANRYWRSRVMGRGKKAFVSTYVSAEAKQYKQQVAAEAAGLVSPPLTGPVEVHVDVYRPKRIGDLDNYLKVTFDSLIGIAYDDDKQITRIVATRHDDKTNPRLEVKVLPL